MYHFLYSEVFLSFRDVAVPQSKSFLNIESSSLHNQTFQANEKKIVDKNERQSQNQKENGGRIARELLGEYISRVIKCLKDPKLQALE